MESKWIIFQKQDKPVDKKTDVYRIHAKDGNVLLGEVKWFGAWRKYAFYPATCTVFETDCLTDIVKFINRLMNERKAQKQQDKELLK